LCVGEWDRTLASAPLLALVLADVADLQHLWLGAPVRQGVKVPPRYLADVHDEVENHLHVGQGVVSILAITQLEPLREPQLAGLADRLGLCRRLTQLVAGSLWPEAGGHDQRVQVRDCCRQYWVMPRVVRHLARL